MRRSRYISQAGVIAAVYAALSFLAIEFGGVLAIGPIQFRVSEAFTVIAVFTPAAIPGLWLGAAVANLTSVATFGALGMLDVLFGSLGSLLGAAWTWRFRKRIGVALLGPVIFNALIVPAYLPVMLKTTGLYNLNILGIQLSNYWLAAYLFGVVSVGVGEAVVVYGIGWPLVIAFRRLGLGDLLSADK